MAVPKHLQKWQAHLSKVKKANPSLSLKQAMKKLKLHIKSKKNGKKIYSWFGGRKLFFGLLLFIIATLLFIFSKQTDFDGWSQLVNVDFLESRSR